MRSCGGASRRDRRPPESPGRTPPRRPNPAHAVLSISSPESPYLGRQPIQEGLASRARVALPVVRGVEMPTDCHPRIGSPRALLPRFPGDRSLNHDGLARHGMTSSGKEALNGTPQFSPDRPIVEVVGRLGPQDREAWPALERLDA